MQVIKDIIGGLDSYIVNPASGKEPRGIVVLLHGYGANGQDLIGIGAEWARDLPDCVFVSPDAPFPCELSPMGRQWFSLREYTETAMTKEIETAWKALDQWLDVLLARYGLDDKDMILSGFSQGCMMSLYAATRRKNACAGVLGYSGRLLGMPENHSHIPVHLIHGEADAVVPVSAWHDAKALLESKGFTVTGHTTPHLPHGIDPQGIESGLAFIRSHLPQ